MIIQIHRLYTCPDYHLLTHDWHIFGTTRSYSTVLHATPAHGGVALIAGAIQRRADSAA